MTSSSDQELQDGKGCASHYSSTDKISNSIERQNLTVHGYVRLNHNKQIAIDIINIIYEYYVLQQLVFPFRLQCLKKMALFSAPEEVIHPLPDVAAIQCKNDRQKFLKA